MNSNADKGLADSSSLPPETVSVPTEPANTPENPSAIEFPTPVKAEPTSEGKTEAPTAPQQSEPEVVPKPKHCTVGSLDLRIRDYHGDPIASLGFRVLVKKEEVFRGATDAKGEMPTIEGLKIGSIFEIQIKKDVGDYKFAAIGKIEGEENYACLQSPKTRFEFSTLSHSGSAGHADASKQKTIQNHNQKPADKANISGNPDKKPEVKDDRDAKGNPKASVIDGLRDWYNRNADNAALPHTAASDLDYVKKLIDFGEKQAKWKYEKTTISNEYIQKMAKGTFVTPGTKESDGYKNSVHQCTKYVKIALWHAGYNLPLKEGQPPVSIGSNVVPARLMGPALEEAGFQNVTQQLPDARWAAPGDVIVYKRTAAPNDAGHIDIRTYDGYLSDFLGLYLPVRQFTVTGIYRKHSDLLPEKRMRAFLMVIASREATTIFLKDGYQETYRALPGSGKFDSFKTHPFAGRGGNSASGAYGILVNTWKIYLPFLVLSATEDQFSTKVQDRIAITIMQETKNALALVRLGRIEEAVTVLKLKQWPSLPGGDQSRGFTVAEMMSSYNSFLEQLS